jgi:hypothetical protein
MNYNIIMENIKLDKLDNIITIENPYILIIGMINSGKSNIIKQIHKYNKIISSVAVVNTEMHQSFYKDFIKDKYIYFRYNNSILPRIFERQKLLIKNNKEYKTELILDNCMSARGDWIKNEEIKDLFYNKNKHKLTTIISFSFSLGIPVEIRQTFDYIFLLSEHFSSNRKRLFDHYGYYIFSTFEEFNNIFIKITDNNDYNCIVLDMKNKKYFIYNSHNKS